MLKVVESERVIMVDVDDTLILHDAAAQPRIYVIDPLNSFKEINVGVHKPMVRLVKEELQRGSQVVIWSRGGWQWAKNVVEALELQIYADEINAELIIMTKPYAYFDDQDVSNWLKDRVFLDSNKPYKE